MRQPSVEQDAGPSKDMQKLDLNSATGSRNGMSGDTDPSAIDTNSMVHPSSGTSFKNVPIVGVNPVPPINASNDIPNTNVDDSPSHPGLEIVPVEGDCVHQEPPEDDDNAGDIETGVGTKKRKKRKPKSKRGLVCPLRSFFST